MISFFIKGGGDLQEQPEYYSWHETSKNERELIGDFTLHVHNCHELILTKLGTLDVCINEKRYTVPPKSLIICNNMEAHLLTPLTYPYERYGMHISVTGLRKIPLNIAYFSIITNHPQMFCNILDVSDIFDEIENIFKEVNLEILSVRSAPPTVRDEYSNEIVRQKLGELLLKLKRNFPDRFAVHKEKNDYTILKIQQYIDENFAKDISINELSHEAFISHTSFINAFKKLTGHTPKHYLLVCRLSEAKALLCQTNESISEISRMIGFRDSNSFIRFFRKEIGMTPGDYRKLTRGGIKDE